MAIQRWDPFRDLRMMDDTVNRLWRGYGGVPAAAEDWNLLLDVVQRDDDIVVKASIPGVKAKDIDVSFEDNVLTIKAEKKSDFTNEKSNYLIRERSYGSFYRALRLPESIDSDKIECGFEDGVLTVTLPKAEEKKKKQLKINVAEAPKEVETKK
jgi:HSP20 family protein